MKQLLRNFREEYLESLIALIWRQWVSLGVAGSGELESRRVIDPEALLAITATVGRYEARLFDEAMDWLQINGRFLNIQRLKTILRREKFAGLGILSAIAEFMATRSSTTKWQRLADSDSGLEKKSEPLFFFKGGSPQPVLREPEAVFQAHGFLRDKTRLRGQSQPFRTEPVANLHLKLRAFLGINARCEILLYLLMNRQGHPGEIARQCYYYQKTVQDTLVDMRCSGLVQTSSVGRERWYRLVSPLWKELLVGGGEIAQWVCWPPFFSALERICLAISDPGISEIDQPLFLSLKLRELMNNVRGDIERAGLGDRLSDDKAYIGEEYISIFFSDIRRLFDPAPGSLIDKSSHTILSDKR